MMINKFYFFKRLSILSICILVIVLLLVNCVNAKEKIDAFKTNSDIIIDGKWTNSDEWNGSAEELFTFVKGNGIAYIRLLNDDDYLYVIVEHVSNNDTKTGDSCFIVIDTKNDGGTEIQLDDLAVLIRWNSPTVIYPAIQWEGWTGSWESLPSDIIVASSSDSEYSPYNNDTHLIYEFKIPRDYFEPNITQLGFLSSLFSDNENNSAGFPALQPPHSPDDWYELILFNETIQIYNDAVSAVNAAITAIDNAESEGRTEGLSAANMALSLALESMDLHDYNQVSIYANQASINASDAIEPTQPSDEEKKDTPGFEIFIVIFAISLVVFFKRKKSF